MSTLDEDNDPWACFGDSDDDNENDGDKDGDGSHIHDKAEKRRALITKANRSIINSSKSKVPSSSISQNKSICAESKVDNKQNEKLVQLLPPTLKLWNHRPPPLFLGPMAIVEDKNAYRGYVATEDLAPGTLLLVEEPIFLWPREQIGTELGLSSIQAIIEHKSGQNIVNDMEFLYPTKIDVDLVMNTLNYNYIDSNNNPIDAKTLNQKIQILDMIEIMQMQHSGSKDLDKILNIAKEKNITTCRGISKCLDEIDVMRMLLALRYNGFDSGVYLHFALFNHSDDANCIKYLPESNMTPSSSLSSQKVYSEVRTTKFVKRGESLTLHYLNPREVSHASRRIHIWDQHRFDIGDDMKNATCNPQLREMELIDGTFPPSSKDVQDHERVTYFIEKTIDDLQSILKDIESASIFLSTDLQSDDEIIEMFERCKALELAAEELVKATITKTGNKKHILLIRCCRLHLDSSEILLKCANRHPSTVLTNKQQNSIMSRFVQSCHTLLPIQIQYLGENHPDIARTNYDFAMGINVLLANAPKRLFDLNISYLNSFNKCQIYEAKCQKEYRRIDALYPKDVEAKINDYQKKKKESIII